MNKNNIFFDSFYLAKKDNEIKIIKSYYCKDYKQGLRKYQYLKQCAKTYMEVYDYDLLVVMINKVFITDEEFKTIKLIYSKVYKNE